MTYSLNLRKKALEYLNTFGNREKVEEAFNISLRTLERWIRRRGENCLSAKQGKSSSSKIDDQQLRLFVLEHPDAYLRKIAEKFGTTLQARFYACKRLKISLKKDPLLRGERWDKKTRIHKRAGKNS
jgi:transposase